MTVRCETIETLPPSIDRFDRQVALIIPAYNEAAHIADVISRCQRIAPAAIVVINDASKDETGALLDELASVDDTGRLIVLHNHGNLGKQGSVRRGLRELAKRGPRLDAVALLDGDGQHDPAELPPLATLLEDHDVVIGARAQDEMPLHRRMSNGLVNVGYAVIGGVDFVDVQSGLRLYRWSAALTLAEALPEVGRYGIEHESLAILARRAQRHATCLCVAAATISCAYGEAESSIRKRDLVSLAYHTLRQALRVRRAQRPLSAQPEAQPMAEAA
jgi:glycosyltransferase involved in cell wall biosynthesis